MLTHGKRPRELRWFHAGPMLWGDWGTSRLYVLGLAFAATGHGSFVYVAWMGLLLLVVAWAYSVISAAHPEGGGVYTAARERSHLLGVIGGLLLFADYVVTAAISALSAFQYLHVESPAVWAIVSLLALGIVHGFGPRKAGILALAIAAAAFAGYLVIAALALPSLGEAAKHVEMPRDTLSGHWTQLVHIILALSGVEAVANMTGIMVHPVEKTSRWTIWPVAIEVVLLNVVFALAINGLPMPEATLRAEHQEDMLRVLAEHHVGAGFASVVSVFFALLLLSASSTAMMDMVSIQFSMARDGELPRTLGRLNRFGVPRSALLLAVAAPIAVLLVQSDLEALAALYAIGVVGAICLNCFATGTSPQTTVRRWEKIGLVVVSVVMGAIWVTVGVEKRHALVFAGIVLGVGLAARFAFRRYREVVRPVLKAPFPPEAPRILVASRGDKTIVDQGLERASEIGAAVVVCMIREASFVVGPAGAVEQGPDPELDPQANELFEYVRRQAQARDLPVRTVYEISTTPMAVLADHAVTLGVAEIHVGTSRRTKLEKVLRGSPLPELEALLPEGVQLVVHGPPDPYAHRGTA
jgi:amino acid transporter